MDLQPDGKIVAAGTANDYYAIARFTTSGALDPTFAGDGKEEVTSPPWGERGAGHRGPA
ncbi:MAG TPA: delta-60 repeat domain-containing protein [Jiangellales bacterium]|nr:delta-60 repeat domain-containing protein [Jiangellales bacterium]